MVTARSGGALLRDVAACSISAGSLAVAAELGTLLQTRALIRDAHWRAYASVQLVPALVRHHIPLDRIRADVTRHVADAICPEPLRPIVIAMLVAELCAPSPRLRVIELAVEALWSRGWAPAALAAASAAIASCTATCLLRDAADPLASNARKDLEAIRALVADRPVRREIDALVRRGFVQVHGHGFPWGRFVGDVSAPRSEDAFEPSLPLVIAVADAICEAAPAIGSVCGVSHDRLRRLCALIERLPARLQSMARAHLARARLIAQGERAAIGELRAIKIAQHRSAAGLLLVRTALRRGGSAEPCASRCGAAGDAAAVATRLATLIDGVQLRQRADLAIAQHLFAIKNPLRARRVLAKVTHANLQLERWQLLSAITIQLRPRAPGRMWMGDVETTSSEPAWTAVTSTPAAPATTRATFAAMLLRLGLTGDEDCAKTAARELARFTADREARATLLDLIIRAELDPFAALEAMHPWAPACRIDPLIAELIAIRASRIAQSTEELPEPMQDGLANRQPQRVVVEPPKPARVNGRSLHMRKLRHADNPDARLVDALLGDVEAVAPSRDIVRTRRAVSSDERGTLERAFYDEGVALQADPEPRRRAIINAARACVRGAIERPEAWNRDVLASRLRTLVQFGGTLARDALEGALAIRPGTDRYVPELMRALCRIDREAAARAALERVTRPRRESDPHGFEVLRLVELHGGFACGFAQEWRGAHAAIAEALQSRDAARAWLAGLLVSQGVPSNELLAWVAKRAADAPARGVTLTPTFPATAQALLDEARERVDVIRHDWPQLAARRLADDGVLLDTLLMTSRPKLDPRAPRWSHADWTKHLRRAASVATGVVDAALVARCAKRLGKPELARWLLAGDVAALGVERTREVGALGLRVRLLDKRLDLLTYLRFADVPVWSCYRSDSSYYAGTRDDVIAVWKDPLSMCFRIERGDGRPWGFVFGGFAELDGGRMAIALNGLYLQRQSIEARAPVLAAIEHMLAPLGCAIGIGNQFGGEGPLPDPYSRRAMRGTRWRAVRIGADLVRDAYDDVSYVVNGSTELDLWWQASVL